MTKSKIIYQVDAFTAEPFKGNPAGVCILEKDASDEWMQNVAAEMNLSETAFLTPDHQDFRIRYFTPAAEIPLCGHATLSSAHILYEKGLSDKLREVALHSKAGKLSVRYDAGWITMNFPSYPVKPVKIQEGIENIIGIVPAELYRTDHGWSFAVLHNEKEVRNLKPDFGAMKNSEHGDLIVTAPSEDKTFDFCVRCFAPALGIDEDPVTGSAHCALVPFWHKRTGRIEMVSHQVSKRGGILKVADRGERVEISGQAVTVMKIEMFV